MNPSFRATHRDAYRDRLPARIAEVHRNAETLVAEPRDREALASLHRALHGLAGTGATFGYTALGDAARSMDEEVRAILEREGEPHPSELARLLSGVAAIDAAVEVPDPPEDAMTPQPSSAPAPAQEPRLLFYVEQDARRAHDLAAQVGHFGYTVRVFPDGESLAGAVAPTPPTAILCDLPPPGSRGFPPAHVGAPPVPLFFLSARDDLEARLLAVRAGGVAFFTQPLNLNRLVDALETVLAERHTEPFRILLIEDDVPLGQRYAQALERAGMRVSIVTDPLRSTAPLVDDRPDLILLDMYLPGCDGAELAAVIRQDPACLGIPIVYLSAETDPKRQFAALRRGADDFLTKPIATDRLVLEVTARVERARVLRSLMLRDGLTGLYNHTTTKQLLDTELARAARDERPVSLALIDIDHFKQVNDTYGHPAGDRVLKNLSWILQRRMRRTDLVGRYGGEEFAVILPGADGAKAFEVLDAIRATFSQVRQETEGTHFYVSLSAGIATHTVGESAGRLIEEADAALYLAKREGRNRVCLSRPGAPRLPHP